VPCFNPPPIPVPPVEELKAAAMRLTAELDQAKLHQAAAHVSMAVHAITDEPDPAVNDNVLRSDVECQFEVDEYDRVWIYRDGDCTIIGRKDYIRTEMWRFLRVLLSKPFQRHRPRYPPPAPHIGSITCAHPQAPGDWETSELSLASPG
jgi:hypothetical protein